MRLAGKSAIVAGVGQGMGGASALLFAQEGADVTLIARKPDVIEPLAEKIRSLGRNALPITMDAASETGIVDAVERTAEEYGKVDVFMTLPGGGFRHVNDLVDMEAAFFQQMFNNHLMTLFYGVQAVVPYMKDSGGSIITVTAAETVMRDGNTAYSTMKEGVIGFSKNLARELQPYSIRVNVVSPGLIRLPMETETVELPKAELQRRGQPEDVAYAALYFASDESRWVTGQVLSVDGGADVFVNHERVSD